jgi:hypothetical protein
MAAETTAFDRLKRREFMSWLGGVAPGLTVRSQRAAASDASLIGFLLIALAAQGKIKRRRLR